MLNQVHSCAVLSVNGETKSVMKGITHGACDYLLKPVRIEELRNIWQHVVRRKFSKRERSNLDIYKDLNKPPSADSCHGHNQIVGGASDQSGRVSKKRKEMHSDEEDDGDDNDFQEGDEPSAAKKPRVVWSVELHRKFVAAVNQLGIDSKNAQPPFALFYCPYVLQQLIYVVSFILLLMQKLYRKEFLSL